MENFNKPKQPTPEQNLIEIFTLEDENAKLEANIPHSFNKTIGPIDSLLARFQIKNNLERLQKLKNAEPKHIEHLEIPAFPIPTLEQISVVASNHKTLGKFSTFSSRLWRGSFFYDFRIFVENKSVFNENTKASKIALISRSTDSVLKYYNYGIKEVKVGHKV